MVVKKLLLLFHNYCFVLAMHLCTYIIQIESYSEMKVRYKISHDKHLLNHVAKSQNVHDWRKSAAEEEFTVESHFAVEKKWKLKVKSAAEWTNRPPPFIITTSKSLTEHFSWNWQFGMTLLTYGGNIAVHWFSDVPGMLGESLHCHKNKLWLLMTYWHYIDDPGHSHCTGIG